MSEQTQIEQPEQNETEQVEQAEPQTEPQAESVEPKAEEQASEQEELTAIMAGYNKSPLHRQEEEAPAQAMPPVTARLQGDELPAQLPKRN